MSAQAPQASARGAARPPLSREWKDDRGAWTSGRWTVKRVWLMGGVYSRWAAYRDDRRHIFGEKNTVYLSAYNAKRRIEKYLKQYPGEA